MKKFVAVVLAACTLSTAVAAENAQHRPNILFIYTDDQAPTAVGAAGNKQIHTPNLDRLFKQGAYLRNAFVSTPVCSPARASLMTSRYGSEVGITDYITPREGEKVGLEQKYVTWVELLRDAGYATGLVGKWHLGTAARFHPTKHGYEYFFGFLVGGNKVKDPVLENAEGKKKYDGLTVDILTEHALAFIEKHRAEPFCLSLHYRAPHAAWLPVAPEDWTPYAKMDPVLPDPDWPNLNTDRVKKMTREYYASVSGVDRNVGRLLAKLDQLKLADNTIVIFTSDHGYNNGHNALWFKGNAQLQLTKLPKQKWPHIPPKQRPNLLDQSLRVPTAVRWPGVIKPGSVVDRTVSSLDWYPTLLAMAGVELPQGVTLRGRNALPVIQGEAVDWNDDMYTEYSMKYGAKTHMRSWRTPRWKLMIDFKNPGRAELYDLAADPTEKRNLIESSDPAAQAARKKLEAKIHARMREIGDRVADKDQP